MKMYCSECHGLVYWDSLYNNDSFIDLACLMCGRRKFVGKETELARKILGGKR